MRAWTRVSILAFELIHALSALFAVAHTKIAFELTRVSERAKLETRADRA